MILYKHEKKNLFFIGSRYAVDSIRKQLVEVVEKHIIEYGVTVFTVGRYGNFDHLVIEVLCGMKKQYEEVELNLLVPYALSKKVEALKEFDWIFYPEGLEKTPFRYAIIQVNRYMVKTSDYLIVYPGSGNSRNIVEYAQRLEKKGLIKVTLL